MKSIKNYFKYLIKNHIIHFIILVISFFVSSLAFLWFTIIFPMDWWFGFIFFLPFLVVSIFSTLAIKIGSIDINKYLSINNNSNIFAFVKEISVISNLEVLFDKKSHSVDEFNNIINQDVIMNKELLDKVKEIIK